MSPVLSEFDVESGTLMGTGTRLGNRRPESIQPRLLSSLLFVCSLSTAPLVGQTGAPENADSASSTTVAESTTAALTAAAIARGDSLHRALDPHGAFQVFDSLTAAHPNHYPALWRAAKEAVYVGMLLEEEERDEEALGWFAVADTLAQRSVQADSMGSDGYLWLSIALGRLALKEGPRSRIRFAERVRDAAETSLALDSLNAGAHHVYGVWHWKLAEVGGFSKFFAKNLFGGEILDDASWDEAVAYLRRSVELEPWYMFHRLELARLYAAMEWNDWAIAELRTVLTLDVVEPTDPPHMIEAREMLAELEADSNRSERQEPNRSRAP